jgi:hypothetical protein
VTTLYFQLDLLRPFANLMDGVQGGDDLVFLIFGFLLALFKKRLGAGDFFVGIDVSQMARLL